MEESMKKAQAKYNRANTKAFNFKLLKKYDIDVIEKLERVSNKSDYIRTLIRNDQTEYLEMSAGKKVPPIPEVCIKRLSDRWEATGEEFKFTEPNYDTLLYRIKEHMKGKHYVIVTEPMRI